MPIETKMEVADTDIESNNALNNEKVPPSEDNQKEETITNEPEGDENGKEIDLQPNDGFLEMYAKRVARNPRTHLLVSLTIAIILSAIAFAVGDFSISSETGGWQSRGTLLADRHTQQLLTQNNAANMFLGGDEVWDDLIDNVQPGWQVEPDATDDSNPSSRRNLLQAFSGNLKTMTSIQGNFISTGAQKHQQLPIGATDDKNNALKRHLQDTQQTAISADGILDGCDIDFYDPSILLSETRLWPVWKTKSSSDTILRPDILLDICLAEEATQLALEEEGLCIPCGDTGKCLPPFSIVFYARLVVDNGMTLSCQELSEAWAPFEESTTEQWKACVTDVKKSYDPDESAALPASCPFGFLPSLVDDSFDETSLSRYSSSIFATRATDVDAMYNIVDRFDRSNNKVVNGAYDTQFEDFVNLHTDESLESDLALAMVSGLVVTLAIVIHTKSLFLSLIGLIQIILSFPLAYFVYKLLIGLEFFPFLNFIGLFVVFALGAGKCLYDDHIILISLVTSNSIFLYLFCLSLYL